MFTGAQSIAISANQKEVFSIAETYPKFVGCFLPQSQIINQSNNRMEVKVCSKLLGFYRTEWYGQGTKKPYREIFFEQTEGLFKGLTAVWIFEENDGITKATITTTFSKPTLGKFLEYCLGKLIVEGTTREILRELKNKAERYHSSK